jgi:hypothetical protein
MKQKINLFLYKLIYWKYLFGNLRGHRRQIKRFCHMASVKLKPTEGEDLFVLKWRGLYPRVDKIYYRFYANYIGKDPNIVPDDCFHTIIEPTLNNQNALTTYADKNMFELLFPRDFFPVCIVRKMGGTYMDRDYNVLQMDEKMLEKMLTGSERIKIQKKFIIKPATETGGGRGVRLFTLDEDTGEWISNDKKKFSFEYLEKQYKHDFIIQECIEPSDFVRQFNPVSYSTIRIFTYRSVKDDQPHFIGGYLRVGAKGSFRDNMGSGGYSCPIDKEGNLADFASNIKRQRFDNINDVSLTENHFVVPNFGRVLEYVFEVAKRNIPNRLLSFDVMLDKQNNPHLIEYNIKWQTVTTVQTTTKAFFGEYTDEVIEFCKQNLDNLSYVSTFAKS